MKALVPYSKRVGRRATSWLRHHPSFLIIGGVRCGTTSLIRYLDQHPSVGIQATGEVHFYDWHFHRGENWYRSWFPLKVMPGNNDMIVGEKSPTYLMDPSVPERVAATMPDARLILLVRDPVERAHSHYRLNKGRGSEPAASFAEALEDESRRIEVANKASGRRAARLDCYFQHGNYAAGLERWLQHFDREQILTIKSEDFYLEPAAGYKRALEFLDLPSHDLNHYRVYNAAAFLEMDPAMRGALADRYRRPNEHFYQLLGTDLGWT